MSKTKQTIIYHVDNKDTIVNNIINRYYTIKFNSLSPIAHFNY